MNGTEKQIDYHRLDAVDYAHRYTEFQGRTRVHYHCRYVGGAIDTLMTWSNPDYFFYFCNCANFLSQCLHCGGGIPMTKKWYHSPRPEGSRRRRIPAGFPILLQKLRLLADPHHWDVSDCWRSANENFLYLADPANGFTARPIIPVCRDDDLSRIISSNPIRLGDVIYLHKKGKAYHCLLITRLTDREIYYSANKYTRYDMELSIGLQDSEAEFATIVCLSDRIPLRDIL